MIIKFLIFWTFNRTVIQTAAMISTRRARRVHRRPWTCRCTRPSAATAISRRSCSSRVQSTKSPTISASRASCRRIVDEFHSFRPETLIEGIPVKLLRKSSSNFGRILFHFIPIDSSWNDWTKIWTPNLQKTEQRERHLFSSSRFVGF